MANALTDGLSIPDQIDTGGIDAAEIGSGAVMTYNISGGQVITGKVANNIAIGGTTGSVVIPHLAASTGSLVLGAGTVDSATGSIVLTPDTVLGGNATITNSATSVGSITVNTSYSVPYAVGGSPTSTSMLIIQAGSGATDTGSDANIDFPLAFNTLPCSVVCQARETEGTTFLVSVTSKSGADVVSSAAEESFDWIAIGPST